MASSLSFAAQSAESAGTRSTARFYWCMKPICAQPKEETPVSVDVQGGVRRVCGNASKFQEGRVHAETDAACAENHQCEPAAQRADGGERDHRTTPERLKRIALPKGPKGPRPRCCIRNAAGVRREEAEGDSVCMNEQQNLIVVNTPSQDRARRYGGISKLRIGDRELEANAYKAPVPENTSKGLIKGI
ncbi:hypothetical protein HPB51_025324 [Rhipicephalus microplus]|uniref:Uncharacterized protein n=1 Tax=Rhipicephalus microplus TaxID=6941 RepID=A0A9J6F9N3_RHIMP|nr:hypothetical protein HPB51_025324 [Rhipicephalus microplus]